MADLAGKILIGTILLDVNRWGNPKTPTYAVSEWADRFREAGFDGMELWEYHATLCSQAEREKLIAADFPALVYNTYCDFDDASAGARQGAADMIARFGSVGVKFNVGKEPGLRDAYLKNLRAWRKAVPDSCTLLCECHPGTMIEKPDDAKRFFDDLGVDGWGIIVHCFIQDMAELKRWFDKFGPKVVHAHVQLRNDQRQVELLRDHPARAKEAMKIMRDGGFAGSFAIEFSKGTREPGENMADLWQAAKADLDFLRTHWA